MLYGCSGDGGGSVCGVVCINPSGDDAWLRGIVTDCDRGDDDEDDGDNCVSVMLSATASGSSVILSGWIFLVVRLVDFSSCVLSSELVFSFL